MSALKRIEKELKQIGEEEFLEEKGIISAGPIDESNMYEWEAEIKGPEATPYESGTFILSINFKKDYPYRPPSIYFLTKIFHRNIHSDGEICCLCFKLLHDNWDQNLSIIEILTEIINLLKFPNFEIRPHGKDFKQMEDCYYCYYMNNIPYYNKIANEWTLKYAEGKSDNYINSNGRINEYNEEISELINNCEKELVKVNEYYLKLLEVIKQNREKIEKVKNELKQLNHEFSELYNGDYYYLNRCKLKDLRDSLYKKDKEINELNLYIPLPIKEQLMTIEINSLDQKVHFITACHKTDYLSSIEKLLYEKYPKYEGEDNLFCLRNEIIDKNKNLDKNKIKDNDIILLKKPQEN